MPLVANQSTITGRTQWKYVVTNTGFGDTTQEGDLSFAIAPASTYNHVFAARYVIAASGTQTVDFYAAFTTLAAETVQASAILATLIKVTGADGILKVEPGASNPLTWPFGASGYETITPSSNGAGVVWQDGSATSITSTVRTWKLTNTGSAQIIVLLAAFVTATNYYTYSLDFSEDYDSGYLAVI